MPLSWADSENRSDIHKERLGVPLSGDGDGSSRADELVIPERESEASQGTCWTPTATTSKPCITATRVAARRP